MVVAYFIVEICGVEIEPLQNTNIPFEIKSFKNPGLPEIKIEMCHFRMKK